MYLTKASKANSMSTLYIFVNKQKSLYPTCKCPNSWPFYYNMDPSPIFTKKACNVCCHDNSYP